MTSLRPDSFYFLELILLLGLFRYKIIYDGNSGIEVRENFENRISLYIYAPLPTNPHLDPCPPSLSAPFRLPRLRIIQPVSMTNRCYKVVLPEGRRQEGGLYLLILGTLKIKDTVGICLSCSQEDIWNTFPVYMTIHSLCHQLGNKIQWLNLQLYSNSNARYNKPRMVNAEEGLNQVILDGGFD